MAKKGSGGPWKECPECREMVHARTKNCPKCGHEFVPKVKTVAVGGDGGTTSTAPRRGRKSNVMQAVDIKGFLSTLQKVSEFGNDFETWSDAAHTVKKVEEMASVVGGRENLLALISHLAESDGEELENEEPGEK